MADIRPFKALRYNKQKIRLQDIITEPYDRIPPPLQEKYYLRSPYNMVKIILGKEEDPEFPGVNKYKRAQMYLNRWQEEGILSKENQAAFYIYEQEFQLNEHRKRRQGLIVRGKLEELVSKKVLPHEKTFPKHKADRLELLRATNTNTGQIFLLYKDDNLTVKNAIQFAMQKSEICAEVMDEDFFLHRLWIIKDEESIQKIQRAMKEKVLIIADGHHRYETSLNYRKEKLEKNKESDGNESYHFIMMTLFRLDDPGLVILPTYRLLKGLDKLSETSLKQLLSPYFKIAEINWPDTSDKSVLTEAQEKISASSFTFAIYTAQFEKIFLLSLKSEELLDQELGLEKSEEWRHLDVAILHSLIIEKLKPLTSEVFSLEKNISYIRDIEQGIEKVKNGEFQMIFLLKPASIDQIRKIVENGELMPQKSTDFFPKLKSGLVMNPLGE
ncbi:DUF1015 domain-containing protein [Acidobacteriota bacterium]